MSRIAVLTSLLLLALGTGALAEDKPGMSPKEVIQRVRKGVMRIQTSGVGEVDPSVEGGGGSGFLFELDYDKGTAYGITNYHVAGKAAYVSAQAWNRQVYRGELVAAEPGIDIALFRIYGIPDEHNLPEDQRTLIAEVLGDSDKVQIGEMAIAMGSPGAQERAADRSDPYASFMLDQTATANVIAGRFTPMDWTIQMWDGGRNGLQNYQYSTNIDYQFRMSTTINHGNSGGPLFNSRGEVIGINTWGQYTTGDYLHQDYNLSVPINQAKDFAYQIINTGKFQKPWLGADLLFPGSIMTPSLMGREDAFEAYTEFRERHRTEGRLEVFGVRQGSPAAQAGLKKGDIIVDVNGRKFATPEEFRHWVFTLDIGTELSMHVLRDNKLMADPVKVKIGPKRTYDAEFSI
jgi:S1-C subfamily serine protease